VDDLSSIAEVLKAKDNFLITSHVRPDGDSIGTQLALADILQKLDKRAAIVNSDPVPFPYDFLPRLERIKSTLSNHYDVAIILDCNEWERVGRIAEGVKGIETIINIDHHSGKGLGTFNYIDQNASSIAEQIYIISKKLNLKIEYDTALCLYVGILTDTGCFRFPNTTTTTHQIVSELLRCGVSPEEVSSLIYERYSLPKLHLLGKLLSALRVTSCGRIAWVSITQKMGANDVDTELLLSHLFLLKDALVILVFRELSSGMIRVNLRAKVRGLDISCVARDFGGGGHPQASGCVLNGTLEEVEERVLLRVKSTLDRCEWSYKC
jgi:phosphoesterase RecJ-like protein